MFCHTVTHCVKLLHTVTKRQIQNRFCFANFFIEIFSLNTPEKKEKTQFASQNRGCLFIESDRERESVVSRVRKRVRPSSAAVSRMRHTDLIIRQISRQTERVVSTKFRLYYRRETVRLRTAFDRNVRWYKR